MSMTVLEKRLWLIIGLIILSSGVFWFYTNDYRARWLNVPPVPQDFQAAGYGLGDRQFAYRGIGLMIQNMGDVGGMVTHLKDYDYARLGAWFMLQDRLDPRSNFMPLLAAHYFGGVDKPEELRPVVDYLRQAGKHPYDQKWRWLAHAAYLARFKMNDLELALDIAKELSAMSEKNEKMPIWTRHMPAFVMNAKGDKQAAYAMLVEILKSEGEKLNPYEVNFTRYYICDQILDAAAAKDNPLCQNLP